LSWFISNEKGDYTPEGFETSHQLLSLNSSISNQDGKYNFHVYAVLGNKEKSVVGGHLIKDIAE